MLSGRGNQLPPVVAVVALLPSVMLGSELRYMASHPHPVHALQGGSGGYLLLRVETQ